MLWLKSTTGLLLVAALFAVGSTRVSGQQPSPKPQPSPTPVEKDQDSVKVFTEEVRLPVEEPKYYEEQSQQKGYEDDTLALFKREELQERALVRCLIEFGLKPWDDEQRVADYILEEQTDLVENARLQQITEVYRTWYQENLEPTEKTFLYHEDLQLSADVVSLLDFPYEISKNWKDHFEGKIYTREELYREEVISTLNYLKLRKIKKLIEENQKDLERMHTSEEQIMLIQTHQHLKQLEIELTRQIGTVILR